MFCGSAIADGDAYPWTYEKIGDGDYFLVGGVIP